MKPASLTFKRIFLANVTLREKFEYGICSLAGAFFVFLTFYTVAKVPYLIPTYAPIVSTTVLMCLVGFLIILVFIQGITAYGFLYSKSWIKYLITLHALAYLIYAALILPIIASQPFSKTVFLSATPYYVFGIILWFFVTLKKPSRYSFLLSFLYLVSVILIITFQVGYNT